MKKFPFLSITILMVFAIAGCAPAAGTIEGRIRFNNAVSSSSVHPCQVSEYSPGTSVDEADIDWSGLASEGWSAAEGFSWQGDVRAPGLVCTLYPELKYEFGNNLYAGDEQAFTIPNVPAGRYFLVFVLSKPMGFSPKLVYGENGVPIVIELTAEHGIDIGLLTIDGK